MTCQISQMLDCAHTLHPSDAEPCAICRDPDRPVERFRIADETPHLVLFLCGVCIAAHRRVLPRAERRKLHDWVAASRAAVAVVDR